MREKRQKLFSDEARALLSWMSREIRWRRESGLLEVYEAFDAAAARWPVRGSPAGVDGRCDSGRLVIGALAESREGLEGAGHARECARELLGGMAFDEAFSARCLAAEGRWEEALVAAERAVRCEREYSGAPARSWPPLLAAVRRGLARARGRREGQGEE